MHKKVSAPPKARTKSDNLCEINARERERERNTECEHKINYLMNFKARFRLIENSIEKMPIVFK